MATLCVPPEWTSPRDDAMQLYGAFKGIGCDTAAVVNILAHRDASQRALIEQEYRTLYDEELGKRLASELSGVVKVLGRSGDVKRAILLWMPDPAVRDATIVWQALTDSITRVKARTTQALKGDILGLEPVTEVICSRTPSQIQSLKQVYNARFHAYLEHDLENKAFDDHKKLLVAYINTTRNDGHEVDGATAECDAKSLYKAGENKLGTDEEIFIRIFSEKSRAHLAAVATAYHRMYGNSLGKAVKDETSGNFRFALLTILRCAVNPGKYFAKVLHKAMKGVGTDDTTLIRVIVTRTEVDMQYIKAEYHKKYGKSLNDAVHSDTSGHYRTFLLALLGPPHLKKTAAA